MSGLFHARVVLLAALCAGVAVLGWAAFSEWRDKR
jgi:hypothetical protein